MERINEIKAAFNLHRNDENALKQAAYMRNKFPFLGLTKPLRSGIERVFFKQWNLKTEEELLSLVEALWKEKEREYHYSAIELAIRYKRLLTANALPVLETLLRTHSWWDSVDTIAAHLIGHVAYKYPETLPIMDEWIEDEDMWIRRTAIIFQLRWKRNTDHSRLFSYALMRGKESEFFIRKAIGWALREYSKSYPEKVRDFLEKNASSLSPLSLKEGSKYI